MNDYEINECLKRGITSCSQDRKTNRMKFTTVYDAWWYLNETEVFNNPEFPEGFEQNCFMQSLDINYVKVNPQNNRIDEEESKNTKVQVWLESGEPIKDIHLNQILYSHNIRYDSGGDTFEDAIIVMANRVYIHNNKIKEEA